MVNAHVSPAAAKMFDTSVLSDQDNGFVLPAVLECKLDLEDGNLLHYKHSVTHRGGVSFKWKVTRPNIVKPLFTCSKILPKNIVEVELGIQEKVGQNAYITLVSEFKKYGSYYELFGDAKCTPFPSQTFDTYLHLMNTLVRYLDSSKIRYREILPMKHQNNLFLCFFDDGSKMDRNFRTCIVSDHLANLENFKWPRIWKISISAILQHYCKAKDCTETIPYIVSYCVHHRQSREHKKMAISADPKTTLTLERAMQLVFSQVSKRQWNIMVNIHRKKPIFVKSELKYFRSMSLSYTPEEASTGCQVNNLRELLSVMPRLIMINWDCLSLIPDGSTDIGGRISSQCSYAYDKVGKRVIQNPHILAKKAILFTAWSVSDAKKAKIIGVELIPDEGIHLIEHIVLKYHEKVREIIPDTKIGWIADNHATHTMLRKRWGLFRSGNHKKMGKKLLKNPQMIPYLKHIYTVVTGLVPGFNSTFSTFDMFKESCLVWGKKSNPKGIHNDDNTLGWFLDHYSDVFDIFCWVKEFPVVFSVDPIHALKGIRNSLLSSSVFSATRIVLPFSVVDTTSSNSSTSNSDVSLGSFIIELLYLICIFDENEVVKSSPKLSLRAINPTNREKMKVNYIFRICTENVIRKLYEYGRLRDEVDTCEPLEKSEAVMMTVGNDILNEKQVLQLFQCEKSGMFDELTMDKPSDLFPSLWKLYQFSKSKDVLATSGILRLLLACAQSTQIPRLDGRSYLQVVDTLNALLNLESWSKTHGTGCFSRQSVHGMVTSLSAAYSSFLVDDQTDLRHLNQDFTEGVFSSVRAIIGRKAATGKRVISSFTYILSDIPKEIKLFKPSNKSSYGTQSQILEESQMYDLGEVNAEISVKNSVEKKLVMWSSNAKQARTILVPVGIISRRMQDVLAVSGHGYAHRTSFKTGSLGRVVQNSISYVRAVYAEISERVDYWIDHFSEKSRGSALHFGPSWKTNDTLFSEHDLFTKPLKESRLTWGNESLNSIAYHLTGWTLRDVFLKRRCKAKFRDAFEFVDNTPWCIVDYVSSISDKTGIVYPTRLFTNFFQDCFHILRSKYFRGPALVGATREFRRKVYTTIRFDKLIRERAATFLSKCSFPVPLSLLQLLVETQAYLFLTQLSALNKPQSIYGGYYECRLLGVRSILSRTRTDPIFMYLRPFIFSDIHLELPTIDAISAMERSNPEDDCAISPSLMASLLGYQFKTQEKSIGSKGKVLSVSIERQLIADLMYDIEKFVVETVDDDSDSSDDDDETLLFRSGDTDHISLSDGLSDDSSLVDANSSPIPVLREKLSLQAEEIRIVHQLTKQQELIGESQNFDFDGIPTGFAFQTTPKAMQWSYWFKQMVLFENSWIPRAFNLVVKRFASWKKIDLGKIVVADIELIGLSDNYVITMSIGDEKTLLIINPVFPLFNRYALFRGAKPGLVSTPAKKKLGSMMYATEVSQHYARSIQAHLCISSMMHEEYFDAVFVVDWRKLSTNFFEIDVNPKCVEYLKENNIVKSIIESIQAYNSRRENFKPFHFEFLRYSALLNFKESLDKLIVVAGNGNILLDASSPRKLNPVEQENDQYSPFTPPLGFNE